MKIEIKSRFSLEILFSHECEDNSVAITLAAAINAKADLRNANLRNADLRTADLYGENLYGADLSGADLYKSKHDLPIFRLDIGIYDVSFCYGILKIGCKSFPIVQWENFTDDEISKMDNEALEFWKTHKDMIMLICKTIGARK